MPPASSWRPSRAPRQLSIAIDESLEDSLLNARLEVAEVILVLLDGEHSHIGYALSRVQASHLGDGSDLDELLEHEGREALLDLVVVVIVGNVVVTSEGVCLTIGSLPRLVSIDVHF